MEKSRDQLIQDHLDAIRRLEAEAARDSSGEGAGWQPEGYYWLFHVLVGMLLGFIGAAVSLLSNVVGASAAGKHPLELIRVYMTFPMGEAALAEERGKVLFVGCVLYLITGGLYGVVFQVIMSTMFRHSSAVARFVVATVIGLGLWVVNFYVVLSWLQPTLQPDLKPEFHIVSQVPAWVAALTHLAFAWTMFLVSFWGRFDHATPRLAGNAGANGQAGVAS